MAPRGKKKAASSPQKQLRLQRFFSPKEATNPRKRKAKEVEEEKDATTAKERDETPTPRSPRKKARGGAEGGKNINNNNNNNNDKETVTAANNNNNNNNNNEKPSSPEKKSGGRVSEATTFRKKTRGNTNVNEKEQDTTFRKKTRGDTNMKEKEQEVVLVEEEVVLVEEEVENNNKDKGRDKIKHKDKDKVKVKDKVEDKDKDRDKDKDATEKEKSDIEEERNVNSSLNFTIVSDVDDDDDDDDMEEGRGGVIGGPEPLQPLSPRNMSEDSRDGIEVMSHTTLGTTRILQTPPPQPKEQKNTFKCKVCEQWFPNRYFQRKHMLMEHENQLYECRVCSFNSVNPEKLKSHIIKQHVIKKERSEPVSLDELKVDLDELITKHTPRKVMMEDGVALGRDASNKMRYICAMCDRIYTSKYSLERHVRCHTGEKPYTCEVCNFSTSYREHMMRHMTTVHLIVHSDEPKEKYIPKNRRKTEEKNVSTEDAEILVLEAVKETSDGTPVEVTPPPVKKRRNILRKRFECAACGLKATHKTDLVEHIKEKHPNAHIESMDNGDGSKVHLIVTMSKKQTPSRRMVITCPECSKVFHDTWKYKVHMRSHTGVKPFGCSICSFFATSKMTVRDHIHRKHKNVDNPRILLRTVGIDGTVSHVELNVPEREFKCEHCGEVFPDNYHMKHHKKKAHTSEAPFSCVECNHREWARANLIIHCLTAHEDKNIEGLILRNNKPYNVGPLKLPKCQQCDKMFPYQSQLHIHMKQHTGERNYFCDMCSYRTNSKIALEKHILKHLGNENKKKTPNSRKRNTKKKVTEEEAINFVDVNDLPETNNANVKTEKAKKGKGKSV